jgi:hypothetical protein
MQSQFKENHELRKFKILDSQDTRDELGMQACVFGALFMYPRLKEVIINTLQHGYTDTKQKRQSAKKCFSNEV